MATTGALRTSATVALLLLCAACAGEQANVAPPTPAEFARQLEAMDSVEDFQALHAPECGPEHVGGAGSRIDAAAAAVTDESDDSATITATFTFGADTSDLGLADQIDNHSLGPVELAIERSSTGVWHFVDCPAIFYFEL